ncbi:substrate-binding domain-containing protein [Arcanobacterium pinnipediorum]|uniref:Substrate-binding domain-containing protein n=1 Tax=Arcanobacterium pinnipediorum TaxID=1503041 RepID=A0ABY5AJM2_9ACTO|nr:substrate-binding domain-containing protein [Arcanobacterium pinnipediorum]USR80052.1 substrate-binding domain-containing protein [Arcanobacterium pinnipediorum]
MKNMTKVVAVSLGSLMALAACSGGDTTTSSESSSTANNQKPLVWFNRQPSNSSTGDLDMDALNFNENTYYVGFDAAQGAELQGQMVADYVEAHKDTIDRNGDGKIGYVLAIGDVGHNDSIARTRGVRKALGTAVEEGGTILSDPTETNAKAVKEGELGSFKVVELASKEMKTGAGATWDAGTAGDTITAWSGKFGDEIDLVISNNDGMGMAMFNKWAKANKVPTFGYDANSDAVAAIADGYGGTISQHADVQAYLTLRVLRNALDGKDVMEGISKADEAGNVLSDKDFKYVEEERSFYALNVAVGADNYQDFLDSTVTYKPVSNQVTADSKKVWLDIYNSADNFLGSTYQPLLEKYDDLLNLEVEYIGGDGQTESNITNRLGNPGSYDAFAINMVKTDNASSYTALLNQ